MDGGQYSAGHNFERWLTNARTIQARFYLICIWCFTVENFKWIFVNIRIICIFLQKLANILLSRLSWPWSYGSWIYNYMCNQCLSPLKLWVRTPLRWCVLDATLCDQVCQWLATGLWFSPPIKLTVMK
jgi:hypothetical protein